MKKRAGPNGTRTQKRVNTDENPNANCHHDEADRTSQRDTGRITGIDLGNDQTDRQQEDC
jgi:hypothetical protein